MTVFPPRMPAMMPTNLAFDQKKRCCQTCGRRLMACWTTLIWVCLDRSPE
jgi:hypothetical protein